VRILKRPLPLIALAVLGICITTLFLSLSLNRVVAAFQVETVTPTPTVFSQVLPTRVPAVPTPSSAPGQRAASNRVRATGSIASASQATLAFQAAGRIKEIKAKEGDKIKAGTVFAALENVVTLDAQVASAQSALDKVKAGPSPDDLMIAKGNLDRAKAAVDQAQSAYDKLGGSSNPAIGATSQGLALQQAYISYQQAVAQFNIAANHPTPQELTAAQATLETAKQNAANARLSAPFDGTVLWIGVRVGESSAVGGAAAAVADLTRMQVLVNVDEVSAANIKLGQPANISVDAYPDKPLKGRVSKIAFLGISTNNFVTIPVTVDIDPTDVPIYPGLSATVDIGNP